MTSQIAREETRYRHMGYSFPFSSITPTDMITHTTAFVTKLPINERYLKEMSKIRICVHKLNIESGQYRNIEKSERKCTICNINVIEDEYYFTLQCL